ncbi:DinB family protein [Kineococcus gypseus]|uniref:DinB family protein n=1 Tax=Kineococcus gypseus TaxID=1637102 RepID=UPI003D7E15FB
MPHPARPSAEDVVDQPLRVQLEAFLDEHRAALDACLDGLSEQQVRTRLVASSTTLLGLVKHATFVERVWFDEAVTARSRQELGIEAGPEESFELSEADTIAGVREAHRRACEASRRAVADLDLDDLLPGNRRGPLPLRWVYLHVLRELAQHCGHADVLREQLVHPRVDERVDG